ncbi:BQ5605_C003g02456 [Microbotryum silenes-dioicae]|uniref:BQ5605_C003g02456 protein n=1 Tax=Microbotryum silenes-dioicae TaxID=796604 RepID=A0A2X0NYW3_9BASI|nr:BQ5605_C003g02456 [Microbotryum silenes-dioicae]
MQELLLSRLIPLVLTPSPHGVRLFFARSDIVATTLLIVQSTFSIAAPLSDKTAHGLEKLISCHTNEIAQNNAFVSCASLYPNATTCSREPLTCSCAAVDCTKTPGTYLSTDAKRCLACNDTHALTCNSTTTLSCQANYTLYPFDNVCCFGKSYSQYIAYGMAKPFSSSQQPFSETKTFIILPPVPVPPVLAYGKTRWKTTMITQTARKSARNEPSPPIRDSDSNALAKRLLPPRRLMRERKRDEEIFFFFLTGAHKLQSFGLAGTATKRAKGGYKATTASSWVKVKPLRAKSAAQIKTRRAPNADSNGR